MSPLLFKQVQFTSFLTKTTSYCRKKRKRGWYGVYFRFLDAQKLTSLIMQATSTTAITATSALINGASVASGVSGSVSPAVVGCDVVSSDACKNKHRCSKS